MDLPVFEIDIIHGKPQRLTDPYACPEKEKDKGTVPGVIDNGEKLLHICGIHGPRERLRKLQPDPSLEE